MEEESFFHVMMDMPDDLTRDGSLTVMRTEDFGEWYRRVRDAHEREVDDWRGRASPAAAIGVRDAHEREVDGGVDAMTDAQLADHGLVRMPVDAEGKPIRIGDVMDKGEVTCIRDCGKGWEVVLNNLYTYDTPSLHHHAPTVEDVLREFSCVLMGKREFDGDVTEAVAEYAAKLRLAGDAE